MNAKLLRTLSALSLALTLTPAFSQTSSPSLPDLQSAGPLGEALFLQSGSTGMVLVVVRDNQVFFRGYGETFPGGHQLPTQDSLLRLCSLTKIFTTDVLSKLAADNTVRLDDPLQRYAPHHALVPRRIQPITLADLATHTSGLPRELGTAPRGTPHFTYPDYPTRWRWLPNQHLRTTPGTAALYSNVAFDLLSDALQSATHKQYAALLADRTINPLHMYNTTFFPTAVQCSQLLAGGKDQGPCTSTEETAGSSGLYSTATDMALWLKYLLSTGNPAVPTQDPSAQSIYIRPSDLISQKGLDHAGEPTGIGLGWIHILPTDTPSHIIEKTGGGAGFSTYIAINHAHHIAIFLAATDGPIEARPDADPRPDTEAPAPTAPHAPEATHLNLYGAANNLLLAMAGLPPLPPPPPKPAPRRTHPHSPRQTSRKTTSKTKSK